MQPIEVARHIAVPNHKQILRAELERLTEEYSRDKEIEKVPGFDRDQVQLLETPRKPLPEWEARKKKSAVKERKYYGNVATPKGMLTNPNIIDIYGIQGGSDTSKTVLKGIESGLYPKPDKEVRTEGGKTYRYWWPNTIRNHGTPYNESVLNKLDIESSKTQYVAKEKVISRKPAGYYGKSETAKLLGFGTGGTAGRKFSSAVIRGETLAPDIESRRSDGTVYQYWLIERVHREIDNAHKRGGGTN